MESMPLALQAGASAGPGSVATTRVTSGSISSTSSRSITQTVNGSHHFKIGGYSLAKGMGIGKYITSETFTVGGYQWAVYFYPDGKNVEDNSLYVSVFIALVSEGTDVRALFELTLLDQSGKEKHKVHSHFDRALESGPYTLKSRGSMWGYRRFFKRAVLEISDYIKDDTLVLTGTVGVVVSSTQGSKLYSIPVSESNIGLHFGELLDSGVNSETDKAVDKSKKKLCCNYCKTNDHLIEDCPKVKQKEAKKKETGMAVADVSLSNSESINMVQDTEKTFNVH